MKILIIEDEKSIAKRIERLLLEILDDKIEKLIIKDSIMSGLDYINHNKIDVLFLDLNLSGKDGFQVLKSVLAESFDTIIVSAYKEKAIEAFEYGVVDFVPKPFDKARLKKAIDRLKLENRDSKSLIVKKQGRLLNIPVTSILFLKGADVYAEVHIENGKKELTNKSLDALERFLPGNFERIHKSYIVDMKRAVEIIIQPGSKYELRLNNDLILPIGRTRYKALKEKYFT